MEANKNNNQEPETNNSYSTGGGLDNRLLPNQRSNQENPPPLSPVKRNNHISLILEYEDLLVNKEGACYHREGMSERKTFLETLPDEQLINLKTMGYQKALKQAEEENPLNKTKSKTLELMGVGMALAQTLDPMTVAKTAISKNPIYYDNNKIWWMWSHQDNKWEIVDETDILNMVHDLIEIIGMTKASFKTALMNALQMVSRKNSPKPMKKTWVQLGDTIHDVKLGTMFPATSEYFMTNPLPYKQSTSEETPAMDQLFIEWVGEKYKTTLYEIIAYCMLPDYPLHRIFAMVGSGSNGKGKYFDIIERFIGRSNIASTELDILVANRFESSKLYKKLIAMMTETNANVLTQTSMLKKLSGGDPIGFEFKNKNGFTDHNYAKILISTNTLPETTDNTDGFYRRWFVIRFPNQFSESEDVLRRIPDFEYNNLATKCLRLLTETLKNRTFTSDGTITERRARYQAESDPFGKYWKDRIVPTNDENIPLFQMEEDINNWMTKNGYNTMTKKQISERVKREGIEKIKRPEYVNGERKHNWWRWDGIRFKSLEIIADYGQSPTSPTTPTVQTHISIRERQDENLGDCGDIGDKEKIALENKHEKQLLPLTNKEIEELQKEMTKKQQK